MTIKFYGDLRGLKKRIRRCDVRGKWRYVTASGLHQFKAETGENLNWWPSTGTLTFQGGDVPVLPRRYTRLFLSPSPFAETTKWCPKQVQGRVGFDRTGPVRKAVEAQQASPRPKRPVIRRPRIIQMV